MAVDFSSSGRIRPIRRADLQKVTATSIDVEHWERKYPWLAKQLGLP